MSDYEVYDLIQKGHRNPFYVGATGDRYRHSKQLSEARCGGVTPVCDKIREVGEENVRRVVVARFSRREDALAFERFRIREKKPQCNVHYVKD